MEEILNGSIEDEVYRKLHVEEDGTKAQLDEEALRKNTIAAEESLEVIVNEKGARTSSSSSSSDDEEAEVVVSEKTDESDKAAEVIEEEYINEVVEEVSEVIITNESQRVEAAAVELAGVMSNQVEYAKEVVSAAVKKMEAEYADLEGTNGKLQYVKEENSLPDIAKISDGTVDSHNKAELPETDGNPTISISARTMQPTSWRGCCGLLEVFKRDT